MVADMNKGFTQEELAFIQSKQLPLPADIFLRTLKEPDYAKQIWDVSGEINKAQQKLPEGKIRMKLLHMMKESKPQGNTDKELAF